VRIAIAGGSAAGLAGALLLARAGHDVVVVDRDPLEPAADVDGAAERAFRAAAPHIVQPHALLSRCRELLADELPDVYAALVAAGVAEAPLAVHMPPSLADQAPRPGDEQYTMLMTRRSTLDWVLLRAAAVQPGVELRGGIRVTGLRGRHCDPPHVTGIDTDAGPLAADVVLDATGRRSSIDKWLAALGGRPGEQAVAECGMAYFSRHYRLTSTTGLPGPPTTRLVAPLEEFTVGIWAADNATMQMAVVPMTEDRRFGRIRDTAVFEAVLRTVPPFAAWRDVLEPITPVYPMAGLHNTLRRLVVDRRPLVTGLLPLGDTVCTTNPTFGRGVVLALLQALAVRAVLAEFPDEPVEQALAFDRAVGEEVAPYYRDQAVNDAGRLAQTRHAVFGTPLAPPPIRPDRIAFGELRMASLLDPTLFRTFWRLWGMIERPDDVYTDPEVVLRTREVLMTGGPPPPMPAPDRDRLLAALAG
jgi:2-polyprenyl-6-methoxyphenol hydroxylase-like FAD-dependent oxidoreductase